MATLIDIRPSITDLPYEEQLSLHMSIRHMRRIPRDIKKKATKTTKSALERTLDNMTPEKAMELLERMKI